MKLVPRDPATGYIDSHLHIPLSQINVEGVKNTLTFELYDQEQIRFLTLYEESEHHLIVPRALWETSAFPNIRWVDLRPTGYCRTGVKSRIKLDHKPVNGILQPTGKTVQRDSIKALLNSQGGTLQLKCGAGKSVVALEYIARRQVPAVIAVDNTHLLHQWQEMIDKYLDVPGGVGLIQGQTRDWRHGVVLATYQTLASWAEDMPEEVRRWFGVFIPDEGHHANAPTFSRTAPLFYGHRFSLTATPERSDGSHVVCLYHIGPTVFKDVRQETPPAISFRWTGLQLDEEDLRVRAAVRDMNGELHLGKLAGFFGGWEKRLNVLMGDFKKAVAEGRKVLALSNSVGEVVNLMARWDDAAAPLFTTIPYPAPTEFGFTLEPQELSPQKLRTTQRLIDDIRKNIRSNKSLPDIKRKSYQEKVKELEARLEQHKIFKTLEAEYRKRQRLYLKALIARKSDAGLFTFGVEPAERMKMLRERKIIFAIMKYGKEGLDDPGLDTIFMCEPVSDRNTIQQIMGRPRDKKNGRLIIFEDHVGPLIGQCNKLRKHFREWPTDEGGPFRYELDQHPATFRRQGRQQPRLRT